MEELRRELKEWEYKFFKENSRKPGSEDIRKEPAIKAKYKQYSRQKKAKDDSSHGLNTPEKDKTVQTEIDETPTKEVFPTPQLNGRVLGLFEMKLPETPSKTKETVDVCTPERNILITTPSSKRTPTYVRQRQEFKDSSPLKRTRTRKSIFQLLEEAEIGIDIDDVPTLSLDKIIEDHSTQPEDDEEPQGRKTSKKTKGQRSMKPALATDVPVTAKACQNFKRLNIQKRKMMRSR